MRAILFACAVAACVAVSAPRASASPYQQANKYFGVRDRAEVADGYTALEIQTQPEKFEGKLLEVRGRISGIGGPENQTTVILNGAEGSAAQMFSLKPGETLAKWPLLAPGASIRALCKVVVSEGNPTGALELVMAVKENEAVWVDNDRTQKALAAKQEAERRAALAKRGKQEHQRMLASRGAVAAAQQAQAYTPSGVLDAYTKAVKYFNRRISTTTARSTATTIIRYSQRYGLDARLVMAVIAVESNFNANAQSPVGAMGLGQLMPGTANDLGVSDPWDPNANLEGSTRLLSSHIRNMSSDGRPTEEAIKLALACYNAGAGAVKKYKGIPPYRETRNYVKKITRLYRQMCGYQD